MFRVSWGYKIARATPDQTNPSLHKTLNDLTPFLLLTGQVPNEKVTPLRTFSLDLARKQTRKGKGSKDYYGHLGARANLVHPDRQESIMKYRLKVQKPRREEAFEPFNLYFMV